MLRILAVAIFLIVPVGTLAQTSGTGTNLNRPSTSQSSDLLQPASKSDGSSLQSTGTGGVTQSPDQSALQRPATSDEAKLYISGDIDSSSSEEGGGLLLGSGMVLASILLAGSIGLAAVLWMAQNRRSSPVTMKAGAPDTAKPSTNSALKSKPSKVSKKPSTKARKKRKSKQKSK